MGNLCGCTKKKKKSDKMTEGLTNSDNNQSEIKNTNNPNYKNDNLVVRSSNINVELDNKEKELKEITKSQLPQEIPIEVKTIEEEQQQQEEISMSKNELAIETSKKYNIFINLHELEELPYPYDVELNNKNNDELYQIIDIIDYSDNFLKDYTKGYYQDENKQIDKIRKSNSLEEIKALVDNITNENNMLFIDNLKKDNSEDTVIQEIKDKADDSSITSIKLTELRIQYLEYTNNKQKSKQNLKVSINPKISNDQITLTNPKPQTTRSLPTSNKKKQSIVSESDNDEEIRNTYGDMF